MLFVLTATIAKVKLPLILNEMSMKPYRISDTPDPALANLHYDLLDSGASTPETLSHLASALSEHEADLSRLREAGCTMTLDCGLNIYEDDMTTSATFNAEVLSVLARHGASLTVSVYKTDGARR